MPHDMRGPRRAGPVSRSLRAMQVVGRNTGAPGLRVLQVGPLYVNQVRRWSEHAAALGHRVWAAGHVRPERGLVELTHVAEDIAVEPEGLQRAGTAARVDWLRGLLRRLEPDLVQAHYLTTWGCYAALAGHRPVLATPWGSDVYLAAGSWRRNACLALRDADLVAARSPHMRREIISRGVPDRRIRELDLGVDLDRFRPPRPAERARARRHLGLADGPVILSPRAGTSIYNLDVVVEAFRIVRARLRHATLLLLCGDAPMSESLRTALRRTGPEDGIRVVGKVSHRDMTAYLSATTVGVSIPSSDGSPSSVWEALAFGVPMVLSDLPQVAERVGGGGAVKMVEARTEAVASALLAIAGDAGLREEMARAGRAWAVANVDSRDQIARLEKVYAAMVKATGGRTKAQPPVAGSGAQPTVRCWAPAAAPDDRRPSPGTARAAAPPPGPS